MRIQDCGFTVLGVRCMVEGLAFRVSGLGLSVFWVWGVLVVGDNAAEANLEVVEDGLQLLVGHLVQAFGLEWEDCRWECREDFG